MATAGDIVNGALGYIGVRAAEEAINASDMADSITILNSMLASWSVTLPIGYQTVDSSTDDVSSPDAARLAIEQNLAIQLAPLFSIPVSADLFRNAENSMRDLRSLVVHINEASFPDTLPRGSGNGALRHFGSNYYAEPSETNCLLSFTGNTSETTLTLNTPAAINATWVTNSSSGFTIASGVATWSGKGIRSCKASASINVKTASGTAEIAVYFTRNGQVLKSTAKTKTADTTGVTVDLDFSPIGLATGDSIGVMIENRTDSTNATVDHATLEVVQCG